MDHEWTAIPDAEVPAAAEPAWQHLLATGASETNKTAAVWAAVPGEKLDFRPHERVNTARTILAHQLRSERRSRSRGRRSTRRGACVRSKGGTLARQSSTRGGRPTSSGSRWPRSGTGRARRTR